jgi:hypothetical protein
LVDSEYKLGVLSAFLTALPSLWDGSIWFPIKALWGSVKVQEIVLLPAFLGSVLHIGFWSMPSNASHCA